MKSFQAVDRIVFVRSRQQMLVAAFLPKKYFLTTFLLNQAHGEAVMPWCNSLCVYSNSLQETLVSSFHRRRVPRRHYSYWTRRFGRFQYDWKRKILKDLQHNKLHRVVYTFLSAGLIALNKFERVQTTDGQFFSLVVLAKPD